MSASRKTVLYGARVVTENGVLENAAVFLEGPHIADIKTGSWTASAQDEVIDARGLTIMPGFLDVHIHGGGGADTMDANPDALRTICRTHARFGTVGLLLTTMTQSREAISAALSVAGEAWKSGPDFCPNGAQVLGVHLEGPYISPEKPGAQPAQFVRDYDADEFSEWLTLANGAIKLITLAPEIPGADALICACREANIVVSMGHTNATAAQTRAALDAGVSHATHLFNAMPPLHHRAPGPVPLLLSDARARVELIADGHHIAPEVMEMVLCAKGNTGVVLITDAMRGAGAGDGCYDLGGNDVTVANGEATLADGTLAGSVLTMVRAAQNVRNWTKTDLCSLARLTATNAADQMGWTKRGRIAPDCAADLVLLDADLNVRATYVAGRRVFTASNAQT